DPGDEAIRAGSNVFRRFTLRTAIAIEFPAGPLFQHVACRFPLKAPVVPLDQIVIDCRARAEAGQLTGLRGPLERTAENAGEGKLPQPLTQVPRMLLASLIQRKVSSTRVLVRVGPGRVAMPGEIEPWQIR